MRRLRQRRVVVKEPNYRPATSIEIDMIWASVGLRIGSAQPNRRRFLRMLELKLAAHREGRQKEITITDAQVRFLARTLWRYRKRIPAELAVAAAMKGGLDSSYAQRSSAQAAQHKAERMRHVEDPHEPKLL